MAKKPSASLPVAPGDKADTQEIGGNEAVNEPVYLVNIKEGTEADGNDPVFVGVNGRHYLIPRGVDCIVPKSVVTVLNEAVITQDVEVLVDAPGASTASSAKGFRKVISRNAPRYSFIAVPHQAGQADSGLAAVGKVEAPEALDGARS